MEIEVNGVDIDVDFVNMVFCVIYLIKGVVGFMGFIIFSKLVYSLENVFGKVWICDLVLINVIVDVMFCVVDEIMGFVNNIESLNGVDVLVYIEVFDLIYDGNFDEFGLVEEVFVLFEE